MGTCNSAPSHGPATYNLDSATFGKLELFCDKMKIRSSVISKLRVAFRQKRRTKDEGEDDKENATVRTAPATFTTSVANVKTEYIDLKIDTSKGKKKGGKAGKAPTTDDIRKVHRDMAEKTLMKRQKQLDSKFKRKSKKKQSFAQKNMEYLGANVNADKENDTSSLPLDTQVKLGLADATPPSPPTNISDTWTKISKKASRDPLQPRRPRPLDTPPNNKKKRGLSAMFSPDGNLAKVTRAASNLISSPFSPFSAKKRSKKKKKVQFDSNVATTIVFSETPTKLTITEFR